MRSLYVDDIITGEDTVDQVHELKGTAIGVLKQAGFELHKWNSNVPELEADNQLTEDSQTYAKEQLGVKTNEAKLLGLPWDKVEDTLAVTFSGDSHEATKRDVLRSLASIYDPLGVASPVTLVGKMVSREACDRHLPWDAVLPKELKAQWEKFKGNWPGELKFPRSLTIAQEPVQALDLHAFCDSS